MTMLNPAVLQNKGVPIVLYVTEPYVREKSRPTIVDGKLENGVVKTVAWRPMVDEAGEPVTTREWCKLDANVLSIIEHHFDGMEGFQKAAAKAVSETVRIVITAVLGFDHTDPDDLAQVGTRLIPNQFGFYQNAIMASLSMASGVDPTNAARLVEEGRLAVKAESEEANKQLVKALEEAEEERLAEAEKKLEEEQQPEPDEPHAPEETGTPGTDGSDSGSASDEPTTSSGD